MNWRQNKIKFGVNNKLSVKLNKKFYKDWEIEKYLDASFDTWFQNKIHLFAEEQRSIVKKEMSQMTISISSSIADKEKKMSLDKSEHF